jgi:type VI secretion system protein ImpE
MSTTGEAFQAGDLPAAIAAAIAAVKASPRESGLRWLMAEMLLFAGEFERADRALDAVIAEEPSPAVLEFRKLLRAEQIRKQVMFEGRVPKFQGDDPTAAQTAATHALTLLRLGDAAGAAAAAAEAEAVRPRTPGKVFHGDGKAELAFDDLRDADDLFAPHLELLTTAGEYMWAPIERIKHLAFDAARRPRDLYWRRTTIELRDGTEGVVFIPAIYPWKDPATLPALKLGRETDWPEAGAGPICGLGQRLLLAGEEALPIAEAGEIAFE